MRPITLLNTDYKLLTKILTARLKSILPTVLGPEQSCGVEGKSIFHNLSAVRQAIHHFEGHPRDQAALIALDLHRAFDSISHSYLFECLSSVGFPPKLIHVIKRLYETATSQVTVNGFCTPKFSLQRGVRQGCPLSMLVFTLVMETLIRGINQKVSGLTQTPSQLISRAWADDIFIFLSKPEEFQGLMKVLGEFQEVSAMGINNNKSFYLPLGSWSTKLPMLKETDCVKILGVEFHSSIQATIRRNWTSLVHKIHTHAIQCISRRLSLLQRVWYTNVYLLSKLWFLAKILPPRKLDTQLVEKYIGYHIWRTFPYRVSRDQIRLPLNKGGLNLVNVEAKCRALLTKHCDDIVNNKGDEFVIRDFNKYLQPTSSKFKEYPNFIKAAFIQRDQLHFQNPLLLNSTKTIYSAIISEIQFIPPLQTANPTWNWSLAWSSLHKAPMSSEWRSSLYLVLNDAVPYGDKLFRHGRAPTNKCPHCPGVESLLHRLCCCVKVQPIWTWVIQCLRDRVKLPPSCLTKIEVLRFDFQCERKAQNCAYWFLSAYIHFVLFSKEDLNLQSFQAVVRQARWQLLCTRSYEARFGQNILCF